MSYSGLFAAENHEQHGEAKETFQKNEGEVGGGRQWREKTAGPVCSPYQAHSAAAPLL